LDQYDAIVVGGGHNGLVTAIELSRAGWRTAVLEQGEAIGGAVRSAEITLPGFVHDLYSTNQNIFCGGVVYAELDEELRRHGLRYATTGMPFASAFPDGRTLKVYQDAGRTMAGLSEHDPADAAGWAELKDRFDRFSPALAGAVRFRAPVGGSRADDRASRAAAGRRGRAAGRAAAARLDP
jgi:phytoene dehydrogenase-like protein